MSRQNNDVESTPRGPATAAFESYLETIEDVEVPSGFSGERDKEAPVPRVDVPQSVVVPLSPPKPEEPKPLKAPTPKVEVADLPASEPASPKPEPEVVPQTPIEPELSVFSKQAQVPTLAPIPAKIEPEKPLSLWERKKLKAAAQPAPTSSLFGGGDATNSSGVWGGASGSGGNTESTAIPTLVGDRQSVFTDTARDLKRENRREDLVEGSLGLNPARRRNDLAQSQMTARPITKPAPAPTPAIPQKSGWGSWGSSLLNDIAIEKSPSTESPPVKPKFVDPPRGFTPNQPPKSQPAGFASWNKSAWGTGGVGDNNAWGGTKAGPTPIAQKTFTGPAWGAKPVGSTSGSGGTGWGSRNLTVDTTTKPPESNPNAAGPENIPESAVEIKRVPAPGRFNSSITGKKEETEDA